VSWTTVHVVRDDLVGTAAADLPDSWRELYRQGGVDPDRWLVVALELSGSYRSSRGALLAVSLPASGLYVDWDTVLDEKGGRLEVRRFPVPPSSATHVVAGGLGLLTQLKRWSVRLALHPLGEAELDVLVDG
jgi:hypothetical protein